MRYRRILLVDDDQDDQEIFLTAMQALSRHSDYTAVSSAEMALKQLAAGEIVADLIFLDLNMPIMSGQQFLYQIKAHDKLKEIPVIILSTSSRAETIKEVKRLGAHDFITKPDRFDVLKKMLDSIIGGN
jgi:CheY-like chemotaxis protein